MVSTTQHRTRGRSYSRASRRNASMSAMQHVYEELRHRIINFEFEPGANLHMRQLVEDFGTSQTPIREAILKLSGEDLVEVYPQSGTRISLIDVQHARETHFLRLSVEIEVLRVLAKTDNSALIDELESRIERQQVELERSDEAAFKTADNEFHEAMFQAAGVPGLTGLLASRRGHYDRIRGLYLRHHMRRKTVIAEHRAMLKALRSHDEVAAEKAVRTHLGKSLAIVEELRERHGNYFLAD